MIHGTGRTKEKCLNSNIWSIFSKISKALLQASSAPDHRPNSLGWATLFRLYDLSLQFSYMSSDNTNPKNEKIKLDKKKKR